MTVPVLLAYDTKIGKVFFFISISLISFFLIMSLLLASIAQWRWKHEDFPEAETLRKSIIESPDWEMYLEEKHRINAWIDLVSKVQSSKKQNNDKRVKLLMASMICFYIAIVIIIIAYIIALYIML